MEFRLRIGIESVQIGDSLHCSDHKMVGCKVLGERGKKIKYQGIGFGNLQGRIHLDIDLERTGVIESVSHRMSWVGRDLKVHLIPTPLP